MRIVLILSIMAILGVITMPVIAQENTGGWNGYASEDSQSVALTPMGIAVVLVIIGVIIAAVIWALGRIIKKQS